MTLLELLPYSPGDNELTTLDWTVWIEVEPLVVGSEHVLQNFYGQVPALCQTKYI